MPAGRIDGEVRAFALPVDIRHGSDSKTPPIRIATDRRGRNREEAGYKRGRCPVGGVASQEASLPTTVNITSIRKVSRGCRVFPSEHFRTGFESSGDGPPEWSRI